MRRPVNAAETPAAPPAATKRYGSPRALAGRRVLSWRVFLTNAAVLIGVSAFLVLTPATVSSPVSVHELLVLVAAITVTLFLDLFLLERAFAPLDELRRLMQRVDPLEPGRRIELQRADADVAELADAFNGMLDRLETERRESGRRALAAQETERLRIARELHDELGQVLTGVLLLLDEAGRSSSGDASAAIEEGREAVRTSIEEVRRIVRDLRPEALDDLGLVSALAALASGFAQHTGVATTRELPAELDGLSPEQELVLYRVVQEALTNVARHADAQHVELRVEATPGEVRAQVRDDGHGLADAPPDHGGIRGMRERALLVRGSVEITSAPGAGTDVLLRIPREDA
ncbi:sensor histidine kinase [Patulibacter americanus]|uniref:sensor histidine kinase n=1 Tax=Patulibacter americanus TaxID=588672 RepID=UPI0003B563C0|nr:sensor histidine kinase [Patulibacter americanus]